VNGILSSWVSEAIVEVRMEVAETKD
jgi:hypothetical protein